MAPSPRSLSWVRLLLSLKTKPSIKMQYLISSCGFALHESLSCFNILVNHFVNLFYIIGNPYEAIADSKGFFYGINITLMQQARVAFPDVVLKTELKLAN